MIRLMLAAAITALSLGGAIAQNMGMEEMRAQVASSNTLMGVEMDVNELSDEQVEQIFGILNNSDTDEEKRRAVEAVLEM